MSQHIRPRSADHMRLTSIDDMDEVNKAIVAKDVLTLIPSWLGSAIAKFEHIGQYAADESYKLTELAKDGRFQIGYVQEQTNTGNPQRTPDYRQNLIGTAESLWLMRDISKCEAQKLKEIKAKISAQMKNIGAVSLPPLGW